MGEYDEYTGVITWQRVVQATEKISIGRRLAAEFPVKTDAAVKPTKTRSA